jgi:hypothetical protein
MAAVEVANARAKERYAMERVDLDDIIARLLPQVLADRELGNGRTFTERHFQRLWALTCLHLGECIDEADLAARIHDQLPARMLQSREVAGTSNVAP